MPSDAESVKRVNRALRAKVPKIAPLPRGPRIEGAAWEELKVRRNDLAAKLGETDIQAIRAIGFILARLGQASCDLLLTETMEIEAAGGMSRLDGQRRTMGGVFFKLAKLRTNKFFRGALHRYTHRSVATATTVPVASAPKPQRRSKRSGTEPEIILRRVAR